ncbi:MAG: hypothetical protein JJ975_01395 [Bacteroidia bacterium]|nr:hypothetical protein [Bacteroidia bacterium]
MGAATNNATSKSERIEILAVVLTGIAKFILMDWLDLRFVYIASACIFWIVYVAIRTTKTPGMLEQWGLHLKGAKRTFLQLLPIAVLAIGIFFIIGHYQNTLMVDWTIIPILLIYPIWGIVQQFIVIGILSSGLRNQKVPHVLVVLLTAVIFAVAHYPYIHLVYGTFLLALVYTHLFHQGRNLVVMGVYHGWLGAFFFYTVLGRHAWNEVFGVL